MNVRPPRIHCQESNETCKKSRRKKSRAHIKSSCKYKFAWWIFRSFASFVWVAFFRLVLLFSLDRRPKCEMKNGKTLRRGKEKDENRFSNGKCDRSPAKVKTWIYLRYLIWISIVEHLMRSIKCQFSKHFGKFIQSIIELKIAEFSNQWKSYCERIFLFCFFFWTTFGCDAQWIITDSINQTVKK